MKILVVWVGAVVPAYRLFFAELAKHAQVHILAPRKWRHGSVDYRAKDSQLFAAGATEATKASEGYHLSFAEFLPRGSRYLIPGLPAHLIRIRPHVVYFMDEIDRLNLVFHVTMIRLFAPRARIVTYALQNIPKPAYHDWKHRLALACNRAGVDGIIAASQAAGETIRKQGYRGPWVQIPLSVAPELFTPPTPEEKRSLRARIGMPPSFKRIIVYAGSLSDAKGMLLMTQVLPRFPELLFMAAGEGPMRDRLQRELGEQFRWMGALRDLELVRFYQRGDYVILPSRDTPAWKEQVGRSLVEGIFCGCLGLGSDSGNIPDVVGMPELVFRQNDGDSLARLLSTLPRNDEDDLRKKQADHVLANYAHAPCALKTARFFAELTT